MQAPVLNPFFALNLLELLFEVVTVTVERKEKIRAMLKKSTKRHMTSKPWPKEPKRTHF